MAIRPITIEVRAEVFPPTLDAAEASFRSVFDALEAADGIRDSLLGAFPDMFEADGPDCLNLIAKVVDLLRLEHVFVSAGGADGRYWFVATPGDRYAELVAAIADKRDLQIGKSHGWPILSLGGGTSSVADAGGETTAPGKGDISVSEEIA
ncbi:hypothetical protein [Rhizorhabdus histidinilytica]|uniref:hypothetical protein n=1 Tax=Rhizorhabdus histidinilytica TaxID=439228 RepID=UPI003220178E